jgi:TolB-like protein/Tfp pilus assembly protein PilF
VVLLLALGYFAFDKFVLTPARSAAQQTAGVAPNPERLAAAAPVPALADPRSLAVLAFANMSADKDNEYFSDGVAEEILHALAQVQDMKVAGRTSSFYFKGRNEPLAAIGTTLGVAHVLEGSVRKQGERLRITAQLTRVSDGMQVWSQAFDGNDADVFALQEAIARKVTQALKVTLNADTQAQSLVNAGTQNPEAYALYLQASSVFNRRDHTRFLDAIDTLQHAVRLDPMFARAYARLASLYVVLPSYTDADPRPAYDEVERYAAQALALDAGSAEAWAARAGALSKLRDGQIQSREAFEQAIRIDPSNSTARFWYSLTLAQAGYRRLGTTQLEQALALDPMLPNALRWRGALYLQDGDLDRAEPLLRRAYDVGLKHAAVDLAEIATLRGQDRESAAQQWADGHPETGTRVSREALLAVYRGIFGDVSAKRAGVQALQDTLATTDPKRTPSILLLRLLQLDASELGLKELRERQVGETVDVMIWLWTRQGAPIRALPEFDQFLRDWHLPQLWDKYGPPDVCTKAGDRYVCQ